MLVWYPVPLWGRIFESQRHLQFQQEHHRLLKSWELTCHAAASPSAPLPQHIQESRWLPYRWCMILEQLRESSSLNPHACTLHLPVWVCSLGPGNNSATPSLRRDCLCLAPSRGPRDDTHQPALPGLCGVGIMGHHSPLHCSQHCTAFSRPVAPHPQ